MTGQYGPAQGGGAQGNAGGSFPAGAGLQFRPIGHGGGGAGPPPPFPVRPAAQPLDLRSPSRFGPSAGGFHHAAFGNHDRDLDGARAADARQSFVPKPQVPDRRGGAPDGSPHTPSARRWRLWRRARPPVRSVGWIKTRRSPVSSSYQCPPSTGTDCTEPPPHRPARRTGRRYPGLPLHPFPPHPTPGEPHLADQLCTVARFLSPTVGGSW